MKVGGVRTCYILPSDCHLQEENKGQWRVLESYLHLDPGEVDNYSGHQTEKSGQEYQAPHTSTCSTWANGPTAVGNNTLLPITCKDERLRGDIIGGCHQCLKSSFLLFC